MKKTSTLLLILCAAAASIFAQPTLQMNVLPALGSTVVVHTADTLNVNPGNPGANQTWNFSALTDLSGTDPILNTYVAPANTPAQYSSIFTGANYAIKSDDGSGTDLYAYYKKEPTQYTFLGVKSADVEQKYTTPDLQLKDLSYNATFQSQFANYTDAGTGYLFYAKGTRTSKYDAYGTLTTPGGTYPNAIRLKFNSTQVDSVDLGGGFTSLLQTDIAGYDWFVPNTPGVFVSIFTIHTISTTIIPGFPPQVSDGGVVKHVTYQSDFTTGAFERPEALAGVTFDFAGANPALDQLLLNIASDKDARDMQLILTNSEGQLLDIQSLSLNVGDNRIDIPVSHLPAGAYFATLSDGRAMKSLHWEKI